MTLKLRHANRQLGKRRGDVDQHYASIAGAPLAVENLMGMIRKSGATSSVPRKFSRFELGDKIKNVIELVDGALAKEKVKTENRGRTGREPKILQKLKSRLESLWENYNRSYELPEIGNVDARNDVEAIKQQHKKNIVSAIWKAMNAIEQELENRVPNFRRLGSLEIALGSVDKVIQSFIEYYNAIEDLKTAQDEIITLERTEKAGKEAKRTAKGLKLNAKSLTAKVRKARSCLEELLESVSEPDTTSGVSEIAYVETVTETSRVLGQANRVVADARRLKTKSETVGALAAASVELNEVFLRYLSESACLIKREPDKTGASV